MCRFAQLVPSHPPPRPPPTGPGQAPAPRGTERSDAMQQSHRLQCTHCGDGPRNTGIQRRGPCPISLSQPAYLRWNAPHAPNHPEYRLRLSGQRDGQSGQVHGGGGGRGRWSAMGLASRNALVCTLTKCANSGPVFVSRWRPDSQPPAERLLGAGGGGGGGQKFGYHKWPNQSFPDVEFRFLPRRSLRSGEGGEGGLPPPPPLVFRHTCCSTDALAVGL